MKRQMEYLHKEIEEQNRRIKFDENIELLKIVYLFYDGYDYIYI